MNYLNLDETQGYQSLRKLNPYDLTQLDAVRVTSSTIRSSDVLSYNWAAKEVDEKAIDILADIAKEQDLIGQYRQLVQGQIMNIGEHRSVGHHLTRLQDDDIGSKDAIARAAVYRKEQARAMRFAEDVRNGSICNGKRKFDTVLHIGIGGSGLGPWLAYDALRNAIPPAMQFHLVSNVDPDEVAATVQQCNPDSTLVLVVSKSGTTPETLSNLNAIDELFNGALNKQRQVVAITSENSPMSRSDDFLDVFCIDDYIGGRYSISSAIGGLVISLLYGSETYTEFLAGAAASDRNAFLDNIYKNASLMDAMIGVYEGLKYPATAVIPYSTGLARLPAYLQQLDMESNGKGINRRGALLPYRAGPVVFGEPGTDAQHSFFQLLHQGVDAIPVQFIAFRHPQLQQDTLYQGNSGQKQLLANLVAQIVAFAQGMDNVVPGKVFQGKRPSSLLFAASLNARSLGALIAHFENKIMFQGFAWNINSFDQEGVQLGKILAKQILTGRGNALLDSYTGLIEHAGEE